ncbi:MAG: phosphatase PAP2 family protein, partial [Weeksellaceae bacterium]
GLFRIYNDRHWITDVAAGAGIGILSTKIAYWMHPIISNKIFKTKREINGMILPYYKDNMYGLGMAMRF